MCEKVCLKVLLCVFNFILWVGGGVLVTIGTWIMLDPTIINNLHVITVEDNDRLLTLASYVLIAAGALSFIVGIVGCVGALRERQALLFVYAFLLVIILVAEVVGAALAFVAFYYRTRIENGIVTRMQQQIRNDYTNGTATYAAWNLIQPKLKCCGVNGSDDYVNSRWWNDTAARQRQTVPVTCCNASVDDANDVTPYDSARCQSDAARHVTTSQYYYSQGCYDQLEAWLRENTLRLAVLSLVVALSQILGVSLTCCLRSAIRRNPGKESI